MRDPAQAPTVGGFLLGQGAANVARAHHALADRPAWSDGATDRMSRTRSGAVVLSSVVGLSGLEGHCDVVSGDSEFHAYRGGAFEGFDDLHDFSV
jgi:hypothetical protein